MELFILRVQAKYLLLTSLLKPVHETLGRHVQYAQLLPYLNDFYFANSLKTTFKDKPFSQIKVDETSVS